MAHIRTQVRQGMAAAVTGLPLTGARVFVSRPYPLQTTDLPAILIYSDGETTIQAIDIGSPRTLERTMQVWVELVAMATAALDDTLDEGCRQIEVALANPALVGIASAGGVSQVSMQIEIDGTAAQPVGRARMSYQVQYFAAENAPDVAL